MSDQEEPAPIPPCPEAVAQRALVLSAVSCRAGIEGDVAHHEESAELIEQAKGWLAELSLTKTLSDWERQMLDTPMGGLSRKDVINGSWLSEGVAVLGWALQVGDLPGFDEQCDPAESANSLGFLQARADTVLHAPSLRAAEELQDYNNFVYNVHWRLRDFQRRSPHYDFEGLARKAWGEPVLRYGLKLKENDLAVEGVPIGRSDEAAWRPIVSITQERHRAANWLVGYDSENFYKVLTDT